tara:strand:+ start:1989 stop:2783 length:795 start_codon:yes stop_codon:yes gene_type:complete
MFEGVLKKMRTEIDNPINYFLAMDQGFIHLNQALGKTLKIRHTGSQCLSCHQTQIIFRQGFCKSCFFENPAAGDWIMRPELSKAHLGEPDRNLEYEKRIQLQPHIVYLALSSHLKVGVTRKNQLPTRWIDQGANEALAILEVPNRYLAGAGEVLLKESFSDKTNWRKMLQNNTEPIDWKTERDRAIDSLTNDFKPYIVNMEQAPLKLNFPVLHYPEKVQSLNIIKTPYYEGKLNGIKGQYLIFEDQTVFNVRSNEGQRVKIEIC